MKTFLGIDFGTTQTIVTKIEEEERSEIEIVQIDGREIIETALNLDGMGNIRFFGTKALEKIHEDPLNTFFNFKVEIGKGKAYLSSNKAYYAEDLSLFFLKHLQNKIARDIFNTNEDLEKRKDIYCAIGCPADWDEKQRDTLVKIAEEAGFPNIVYWDEPFGVIHYQWSKKFSQAKKTQKTLVYDFGGGTTDVAIVEVYFNEDSLIKNKVLGTGGTQIGGKNFDQSLNQYFMENLIQKGIVDTGQISDREKKTLECASRKIKERLCEVKNDSDAAKGAFPLLGRKVDLSITRPEFAELCKPLIDSLEKPINDALNEARLNDNEIDNVIIAGGSSRLYYVRDKIHERLPNSEIMLSENPVEDIAKGLALYRRLRVCGKKFNIPRQENITASQTIEAPVKPAIEEKKEKDEQVASPQVVADPSEESSGSVAGKYAWVEKGSELLSTSMENLRGTIQGYLRGRKKEEKTISSKRK